MAFVLADLNDFISPSQACILPPRNTLTNTQSDNLPLSVSIDAPLETATISLTDCLACSGCITSAESILVEQQSYSLLYQQLSQKLSTNSIIIISLSEQSRASLASKLSISPLAVYQKLKYFFISHLHADLLLDSSFSRDISLYESAQEFVNRFKSKQALPVLASSCPGFICYAEKTHAQILPNISTVKSPQQVMGSLVKYHLPSFLGKSWTPSQIFHVSIMPCFDKKLEASRTSFTNTDGVRDVDCVLTTSEIEQMIIKENLNWQTMPEYPLDSLFTKISHEKLNESNSIVLLGSEGSSSGGYLSFILRYAAFHLFNIQLHPDDVISGKNGVEIVTKQGRNKNSDFSEYILRDVQSNQVLLRFASAYGFRNIQNVVRKVKSGQGTDIRKRSNKETEEYHYVEVMACPSGCINGGGQAKVENQDIKVTISKSELVYQSTRNQNGIQTPDLNDAAMQLYNNLNSFQKQSFLYTDYQAVEKMTNNALGVKW